MSGIPGARERAGEAGPQATSGMGPACGSCTLKCQAMTDLVDLNIMQFGYIAEHSHLRPARHL